MPTCSHRICWHSYDVIPQAYGPPAVIITVLTHPMWHSGPCNNWYTITSIDFNPSGKQVIHIYISIMKTTLSNDTVILYMGSVGRIHTWWYGHTITLEINAWYTHMYCEHVELMCGMRISGQLGFLFPIAVSNMTFHPIQCIPPFLLRCEYLQLRQQ